MFDYDEHRRRMVDEMSAFITWGLANPDKVRWIPRHRVGAGEFSKPMQHVFWGRVFGMTRSAPTDVLRRFMRWARKG
jgi:hypothetical protein